MNYARTLLDTYYKLIDDILNGIYDSNKEPPETYSDAWDDTISDGWDDVVEDSELPDENGDGETSGKNETNDNKDTETITTNLGNEIDVTPSKNHSVTTENPGPDGEPNSSIDIIDKNGNIKTRRWFGEDGKAIRDVDMTNHGNCSEHPEWPHEHIWDWSLDPPRQ